MNLFHTICQTLLSLLHRDREIASTGIPNKAPAVWDFGEEKCGNVGENKRQNELERKVHRQRKWRKINCHPEIHLKKPCYKKVENVDPKSGTGNRVYKS